MVTADTFWKRLKGLMFLSDFRDQIMIQPCNQVHTFFMRFAIDIYFLDENHQVIDVQFQLKPWRISKKVKSAKAIIEVKHQNQPQYKIGQYIRKEGG